jgi:drug/metabolite transporter (DMT)-like permease
MQGLFFFSGYGVYYYLMFLFLALSGYIVLAGANILDKYIVERAAQPAVVTFFSTIIATPIFFALLYGARVISEPRDLILALVSGGAFVYALYALFSGFVRTEVSHSAPLTGVVTTLSVIVVSGWLAPEKLSTVTWYGIVLLVAAAMVISFERRAQGFVLSRSMVWLVGAGLLFGISHVTAKILYDEYGFLTGLVWTRGMMGLVGISFLLTRSVRAEVHHLFRSHTSVSRTQTAPIWLIVSNRMCGVLGTILVQAASARGSVVIVNALQAVQYMAIIIVVWCASRWFPRLAHEFYSRGEVVQELVAMVLFVLGFFLVVY